MMTILQLREWLGWCLALNYGVLSLWFVVFLFGRAGLFRLHTRWFHLTPEGFDTLHYAGMAAYKVGILLLNLVPYAALCIVAHR
jgi:hypothetical protein